MHQVIKDNINTHNDATWDEVAEDYNISGANQLFDVIQYTDAQSSKNSIMLRMMRVKQLDEKCT